MKYTEKQIKKANKHLTYAIEDRNFWREKYVENERDTNSILDVKMMIYDFRTLREVKRAEAIENIMEANERISRFQRIAL